jgi:hypothetical protein
MTRERAKELLPIIQAFAEGKEIEHHSTMGDVYGWCTVSDPDWKGNLDYRIKPEPQYRPYTKFDLKWLGKIIKDKGSDYYFILTSSSGINFTHALSVWQWYDPETGETRPFGEVAE